MDSMTSAVFKAKLQYQNVIVYLMGLKENQLGLKFFIQIKLNATGNIHACSIAFATAWGRCFVPLSKEIRNGKAKSIHLLSLFCYS